MSASRRFEMYYFCGKINRGEVSRPLFGGSVIRGFNVNQKTQACMLRRHLIRGVYTKGKYPCKNLEVKEEGEHIFSSGDLGLRPGSSTFIMFF